MIDVDGLDVHVVSGAIRYYADKGGWRTLESQDDGIHPTINIESVESTSSKIIVHFDDADWGRVSPSSFTVVTDETLAGEGLFVGASVMQDRAEIQVFSSGQSDYIFYDSGTWTSYRGKYSNFNWSGSTLTFDRPATGIDRDGSFPTLTPRDTPYNVVLDSISPTTIQVRFYSHTGSLINNPNGSMKFFITDPSGSTRINPNTGFDHAHGNLWIHGLMVEVDEE